MSMNVGTYLNAVNAYMHTSTDYENKNAKQTKAINEKARNMDTVELSSKNSSATEMTEVTRQDAVNAVKQNAPKEKIEALKNAVNAGTYYVPADQIANAILN